MLIVPSSDALTVEAKVWPRHRSALFRPTRCPSFHLLNQRTTPEINGDVSRISADVTQDEKTNAVYYTVRVKLLDDEIARLGGVKLVPGMPVEAFVQTSSRIALSYLTKPLYDQARRAFTER